MARLFNAYVMVDWSAAQAPKTGKDSVWVGVLKRDIRFRPTFEAHNPPTRHAAEALLREVLADLRRRQDRALVGFDFPLGYPQGTAAALKLKTSDEVKPQAAMWDWLGKHVVDKADNTNNRFSLAARMNRLITDEARPFWGAPPRDAQRWLSSTKPVEGSEPLPQLRLAEQRTQAREGGRGKAGAKSVWQLMGAGSVGGQAIMGVPAVKRLVDELDGRAAVWPFTTGWRAPNPAELADKEVLVAEIYPALVPVKPEPGEVADRAQVRTLCEHFSDLDTAGKLAAAFAAPKDADEATVAAVEGEEGWILGV